MEIDDYDEGYIYINKDVVSEGYSSGSIFF